MGTYGLPRDVKGEGRILFVFSTKALIYTIVGITVGLLFYFLLNLIGLGFLGIIIVALLGVAGFVIGTFKIPDTNSFELARKAGGENIDEVIKRAFKFKAKKNLIYVNADLINKKTNNVKEEQKND